MYVFGLRTGEGDNVFLAGSFNNWQRIPLEKIKDGLFYATLKVPKERILYKVSNFLLKLFKI